MSGRPETVNYAKNNLLSRYAFNGSRYTDYDYDGLDRLTAKTTVLQTPIYYNYSYYSSNRNSEGESVYTTSDIKEEIVDNISYLYYYDSKGNITEIKRGSRTNADTNDSATSGYTDYLSYEYDSLNQLTRENNKETNETTVYSYDNAGNITSKKIYAYTVSAEIETELKDTVNYGYGTSGGAGWSKLLTSYNGESIVYNTAGNPTTYRGANLDWYGRELKSYTKGDNTLSFTYDADGLRATKKVNGVTSQYKYDDEHVTYERRGTTDIYYWYDGNGHLFAIRCYFADGTNVLYYATTNSRGDVLGLYTGGGDQQVWYEYDAWGNTTITDTSTSGIGSINPIRYRGYYYDNETDLYYLQSRYYDPETGRFLNADALEFLGEGDEITGYNLFAYCGNNGIIRNDETGSYYEMAFSLVSKFVVFVGVTVVLVGGLALYHSNNFKYSKGGKQNIRDTGLRGLPDVVINKRAKDKRLSKSDRQRYKKEQKARKQRNKQKRAGKGKGK